MNRSRAADDATAITERIKELAAERLDARCSCPRDANNYRSSTDPRCEVHGTLEPAT